MRRLPTRQFGLCLSFVLLAACSGADPEPPLDSEKQALKPGATTPAPSLTPMTVVRSELEKRWAGSDPSCFAVDDEYYFKVAGSLQPGESYTFHGVPVCDHAELPVISARATWDASDLEITSTAPSPDGISDDPSQKGKEVVASSFGHQASLCMFTSPWGAGEGFNWSITITNKGTQTAYNVVLEGEVQNGWFVNFYSQCARADADHDGWNDALEHGMGLLTYHASYSLPGSIYAQLIGSNYLKTNPATTTPDDEVDTYPPDINDDGVVDQTDVDRVASFVGQGTGVPLDRIDPNPGPNDMYAQSGTWRRYDLDGNGRVTTHDVEMVKALAGLPIPMTQDVLAPTVEVRAPAEGAVVPKGSYQLLEAFASDNQWIGRVDFYAGDTLVCSSLGGATTYGEHHQFSCWWKTPRKTGPWTVTARTSDSAGHTASHAINVLIQ